MALSNKKYLGQQGTEALAHGVDIITPRTWVLPAPASEADTEISDDGLGYMGYVYPTPESFKESIPQIKIGDKLDIGQFLGGSIPAIVPIVADLGGVNEITVPWSVGGSKGWVTISEEQIGFVFEYGGDSWGMQLRGDKVYPVWGDCGEATNDYGSVYPNWIVSEDLDCFTFKDKINIALKSTEGVHDVVALHKNWMCGRLLSKSAIEGSDETYGVVVGVAKIATPGSDTETKIVPGIFMLSHKSSYGSQTRVTFYPLINMWQEFYAMKEKINPSTWSIGPDESGAAGVTKRTFLSSGTVVYEYDTPADIASQLSSMTKGQLLVLGGLDDEDLNGKEIPIVDVTVDNSGDVSVYGYNNGFSGSIWISVSMQIIHVEYLPGNVFSRNESIRCNKRHLRKHGHELTARPIRVLTGRLPKMGDKGNRNYYLISLDHNYSAGDSIRVNLWTQALKKWLKSTKANNTTFEIAGVGFIDAWFTRSGEVGYDSEWLATKHGITINVAPEKITLTKPAGKNCIDFFGLVANMTVKRPFKVKKGQEFGTTPFIVRYDNHNGWMAFQQTSGFVLDKLSPITPNELLLYLNGNGDSRKIEVQFRARALKDKTKAFDIEANPRYHFWSQTKSIGCVCRARRTRGKLYRGKSHNGQQVRSHAYRKVGASDWVYFSLGWSGKDDNGKRNINSVRQLS